jgi:hypothetical protein
MELVMIVLQTASIAKALPSAISAVGVFRYLMEFA